MHRLQFSIDELKILLEYLDQIEDPIGADESHHAYNLYDYIHWETRKAIENCTTLKDTDHRGIYNVLKHKISQHMLQVMYHTPLQDIPTLINHRKEIIKAIAKWRLAIAR